MYCNSFCFIYNLEKYFYSVIPSTKQLYITFVLWNTHMKNFARATKNYADKKKLSVKAETVTR